MRKFLLLTVCILILCSPASFAQLIAGYAYMQGQWLEACQAVNGSLGADYIGGGPGAPAGYHAHGFGGEAFVYDYGHDGWAVGTPPYMGDFTLPGTPFDGWEIQINGVRSQAFYNNGGASFVGGGTLTGSNTGYSYAGGAFTTTWSGTAGPAAALQIVMQTVIDTEGSAIVFTVHMTNTSATALPAVYYLRSFDPDNAESWAAPAIPGPGQFYTENTIVHQNEDATHRVLVTALGTYNSGAGYIGLPYAYVGLGTRDCRAKCFIYNDWPMAPTVDLGTVWAGTYAPADYTLATNDDGDIGIGLVYNIGAIGAFGSPDDSAVISYSYILNGVGRYADSGLENPGVFPDPVLEVEGTVMPSVPVPDTVHDTFNVCDHPGEDTVIVNILYGTTGNWTNSHWTWSPSTGLTSTVGALDTILSSVLPPSITYTITGTDSSGPGVMLNCESRVFLLTIMTCNTCVNNSPCAGDTLYLKRLGDSTDCTYLWSGPDGFSSTLQDPFIYPATAANTGEYYVIRTLLGVHDTDSTNAIIHPLPIVTVTSNAPLCTGAIDTLLLSVTPYTAGEAFSWTGPDTFTSALEFPSIDGFMPVNAGIYKVVATTTFGCKDSGTVDAELIPPPPGPGILAVPAYCFGAPFIPFVITGTDVQWYPSAASTVGTPTPPVVNTSAPGTYTYYATQQLGSCLSPKDSVTIEVYMRIDPAFTESIKHGCSSDQVTFANLTRNSDYYTWNWGDGSGITDSTSALITHVHTYAVQGVYNVELTGYNAVCEGDTIIPVDTRHSVHALFTPVPDTFCVGYTTTFNDSSYATVNATYYSTPLIVQPGVITNYLWNFGDGSPTSTVAFPTHPYTLQGAYPVTLIVTDSISCTDTVTETVYVLQIHIHSVNDTTLCLSQPLPLYNTITLVPDINLSDYNYVWTQSAPNLDDTSVQVPYLSGIGNFVDTLTVTLPGIVPDGCPARDTITIHSVLGAPVVNVTPNTTITYGSSIDLNASGEVYYRWLPNDGSLNNNNINNPVATPTVTTTYTVFGLDGNGCLDSAYVTITVDSTMHEGMPGAFTPNGDGLNDVWHPVGLKYQRLVEFRIYNRWGQQVFYSNNINNGWDGTFNSVPQDMGVYFYVVIVSSPEDPTNNIIYKGDITLLR